MTAALRLERKLDERCTRCGVSPAGETFQCEEHRVDGNARSAKSMSRLRSERRARGECIDCCAPECLTLRCASCRRKRYEPPVRLLTPVTEAA